MDKISENCLSIRSADESRVVKLNLYRVIGIQRMTKPDEFARHIVLVQDYEPSKRLMADGDLERPSTSQFVVPNVFFELIYSAYRDDACVLLSEFRLVINAAIRLDKPSLIDVIEYTQTHYIG